MTEKILTSGNFCLSGEKMDRDRAPTAEAMPPVRTHMLLSEVEMVAAGASASVVSAFGLAVSDPLVAKARTSDPDVRYWLGFDIASALFGDPALGSEGSKSTGPGSERIQAGLSAPAQRGFIASTKFHLGRSY